MLIKKRRGELNWRIPWIHPWGPPVFLISWQLLLSFSWTLEVAFFYCMWAHRKVAVGFVAGVEMHRQEAFSICVRNYWKNASSHHNSNEEARQGRKFIQDTESCAVKPNPCPIGTSFIYHTIFLLRYTVCTVRYIPAGGFYGYSVFRTIVSSMYHTGIYLLRVANM